MERPCPPRLSRTLLLSPQAIYKQFDVDRSGTIGSSELPGAFEAAGVECGGAGGGIGEAD